MMSKSLTVKTVAAILAVSPLFCSCSEFDEPGTGIPIKLNAEVPEEHAASDANWTITSFSPVHVIGFARDKKCKDWYYVFESDATIGNNGNLSWTNSHPEWPGVYMKFIAYYPADADVVIDDKGNILIADCILIAETEPVCHLSDNVTLNFHLR